MKSNFKTMDRDTQRAIASKGGKTAHARGVAHEFTRAEASAAGRKGGIAVAARKRAAQQEADAEAVLRDAAAEAPADELVEAPRPELEDQ